MADTFFVEPDLNFIKDIIKLGGIDLKKCFQCATCSVACSISPETKPFPRKEMLAASWGLKDKLIGNGDIWLCHSCSDCSDLCPRGAKPSDVFSAVRAATISEYAKPKVISNALNDPKKLPILLGIPAIIFLTLGLFFKMIGINWLNFSPTGEHLWQADFISNYLVDLVMVPTFFASIIVFFFSIKRFLSDIHSNALLENKTHKDTIEYPGFIKAFINILPKIIKHKNFNECSDSRNRLTPHMMILFSFIALFIVTQCFFAAEWIFHIEGPYSQINPVKWLGNIAGVTMLVGAFFLIKNRLEKDNQVIVMEIGFL